MSRDIRQSYLEREGKRAMNWFERKKIVVPIDFSDESRRVIDAGAVVMPSHGRSGLGRLLLGSVAERVLRLAKCPVLVLKAA